jgi:hypothetical protein
MFSMLDGQNINCAYPIINETIPKSSLGYNTNNQYPAFPPLMSDSRSLIASWQPETVINNNLIVESGIKSNWAYRKYLTNNAVDIMKYNMTEACNDVGYYKRHTEAPVENTPTTTGYMYKSYMDNTPSSVGTSDLKQLYISREQLNSRKISPGITQEELLRSKSYMK